MPSHCFSKVRGWEAAAQRLNDSSKITKIPFSQCWKAVLQIRSSEPGLIIHMCPLHWTEAVTAARLNISVLCRRHRTCIVIQTGDHVIHVSFLCHQVNPASTPALSNWEAQAHPLRNRSVSLPMCARGNAQYSWYTGFTLQIWNTGDLDLPFSLKQSWSRNLTRASNCYVNIPAFGISVSHCFLKRWLFSAWK